MIAERLHRGQDHTRTGKELAEVLNCNVRAITNQIEKERREGQPICAKSRGRRTGYFLAANQEELQAYCDRLHGRAAQIYKTRAALLKGMNKLPKAADESS